MLATIGLCSVIAYAVAQRTRELGVRIALGASMGSVARMVIGQGILFAVTGVALGSAVALFAARWIEPLLFEAAILLFVALAATVRPAVRATRVDPTTTLSAE